MQHMHVFLCSHTHVEQKEALRCSFGFEECVLQLQMYMTVLHRGRITNAFMGCVIMMVLA